VPTEVAQYEPWQRRRLSMPPGITGNWQVSGRNLVTDFNAWMRLDLEYIDRWSLLLDMKILFKTIPAVLTGAGAKSPGRTSRGKLGPPPAGSRTAQANRRYGKDALDHPPSWEVPRDQPGGTSGERRPSRRGENAPVVPVRPARKCPDIRTG